MAFCYIPLSGHPASWMCEQLQLMRICIFLDIITFLVSFFLNHHIKVLFIPPLEHDLF